MFQFLRNRTDWVVNFLLFFLTGIGIVIYLNQPGNQPRERDYAYVGSFYAFAIWIGLAVVGFVRLAREKEDKQVFMNTLIYGSVLSLVIGMMSSSPSTGSDAIFTGVVFAILFGLVTSVVTYLVRALSSAGQNAKTANIATAALCMFVPILMAQQEWDDHDRSKKELARDMQKITWKVVRRMQLYSRLATMTPIHCGMPRKWKGSVAISASLIIVCWVLTGISTSSVIK